LPIKADSRGLKTLTSMKQRNCGTKHGIAEAYIGNSPNQQSAKTAQEARKIQYNSVVKI